MTWSTKGLDMWKDIPTHFSSLTSRKSRFLWAHDLSDFHINSIIYHDHGQSPVARGTAYISNRVRSFLWLLLDFMYNVLTELQMPVYWLSQLILMNLLNIGARFGPPQSVSDFDFWREKNTKCPILVFSARVITIHSMRRSAAVIKLLSFSSLPSCDIFDAEVDH